MILRIYVEDFGVFSFIIIVCDNANSFSLNGSILLGLKFSTKYKKILKISITFERNEMNFFIYNLD